jgi:putative inorganic carbon (hco3(-)) transporter
MSFIFLLLCIVSIYIRPQEWISGIEGWPLIYWLIIVTAFSALVETSMRRKWHLKETPNLLMLGLFGCILMSHISNTYFKGMIDSLVSFSTNVIFFFLFVNVLVSEKKIKIAIWFIIIVTFILAIEGIQQHNNGFGWAGQVPVTESTGEMRIRWIGIFNDPNDLALVFVVAAGFLLSFIFGTSNVLIKLLSVGMLLAIVQALFYTSSRGGYLAMAATTGFFFLRRMKNKILALVIGGILAFAVIVVGPSRMSQLNSSEASAHGRIEAWYQGFQMLKQAPIFGVGHRMFVEYNSIEAHNSYIEVAAELGLVGIFVWISLIYLCFKGLVLVEKKNTTSKFYVLGLESGLFGFLAASFFLSRDYIVVLYILLALAAAFMYTNLKKEEYAFTKKDIKIAAGMTFGILALVWCSMRFSI